MVVLFKSPNPQYIKKYSVWSFEYVLYVCYLVVQNFKAVTLEIMKEL